MTPTKVPLEAVRDLAARVEPLRGRARAAVKRDFASAYGISASSLSRALTEVGVRCHERSDAGTRRNGIPDEILHQIAAIQRSSLSLRKGVVMPAEDAINIAEDSGLVAKGTVGTWYYNNWLREHEASRRDQLKPEPHTELRSLGPNHVHQVDFSLAVNWKMFQGKWQYEHLIYKNKLPTAGEPRLLRLILVDHATGCVSPHYTCSTGETVQALLEGLYYAWSEKRIGGESIKAQYPFRGVPQILMADRGSANQAGVTATILERLGVKLNICEGARSKGAVEQSHGWWETHFESRFRLEPPATVEQLNEWAVDFAARLCACATHSRHGAARSMMWAWHINRRPETQLREMKTDFETFKSIAISDPTRCLVNGNRIVRFRSKKYRLPQEFLPGEYVAVQYSPFQFPQILVRHEAPGSAAWLCEPVELDEFGFAADAPIIGQQYKSQKKSNTARFVDQAEETAKELIAGQQLRVFGHHRHAVEPIAVKHTGSDVLAPATAPVFMSRVQARQAVLDSIVRPFTAAEAAYLNRTFGDQVTDEEVSAAVADIQQGIKAEVIAMGGSQ
jgi:hypothetical protein